MMMDMDTVIICCVIVSVLLLLFPALTLYRAGVLLLLFAVINCARPSSTVVFANGDSASQVLDLSMVRSNDVLKLQRMPKHSSFSKLLRDFGSYGRMWMTPQFFDRLVATAIIEVRSNGRIGIVKDDQMVSFLTEIVSYRKDGNDFGSAYLCVLYPQSFRADVWKTLLKMSPTLDNSLFTTQTRAAYLFEEPVAREPSPSSAVYPPARLSKKPHIPPMVSDVASTFTGSYHNSVSSMREEYGEYAIPIRASPPPSNTRFSSPPSNTRFSSSLSNTRFSSSLSN
ncbi:hypothetical protein WA556_000366, partial [Blastocystis sp. ATCC 50177/Nand II]